MSVAQIAPPGATVLFRHRRRPPALAFGVIGAAFLILVAVAASSLVWQVLAVLAAVAVLGLGLLGRDRLWIEDHLVTDTSFVVTRPDGLLVEVPFDEVQRVAKRRNSVMIVRKDGALLAFNRNPHAKRIERLLSDHAPGIPWVDEVDPACDT